MAGEYQGTAVPYPEMALPDLRDPVLSGPGHRALEDAVGSYHQFAQSLSDAGGAIRSVLTTAQMAHEGAAAEAGQRALRTLSEPGEVGAGHSRLAARSLEDQGGYVARVRADMQAADPGPTLSGADAAAVAAVSLPVAPVIAGAAVVGYVQRQVAREQAAEAATRYQDNTNWNLGAGFQAFPAPAGPAPDTSPGAAGAAGGGGVPAFQIGPAGSLAATAAAGATGPTGGAGGAAAGVVQPPGGGSGGSPAGLVPTLPGGGAGGAGSARSGSNPAGVGGAGPDRGRAGGAGRGTGATGNGGPGTGAAGTGGASGTASPTRTSGGPAGSGPVGSGVGLAPQSYRPGAGRGNPGGGDPESAILSGTPPLPGNGLITPRDTPVTDRRTPAWGNAVPDGPVDRAPLDRQAPQSAAPAGRGATAGHSGMPFMGGAGGAGGSSDRGHPRPSWLVQDDPEAFWFSGLPAHCDAVITPDVDE
jgi:hypothetical protein